MTTGHGHLAVNSNAVRSVLNALKAPPGVTVQIQMIVFFSRDLVISAPATIVVTTVLDAMNQLSRASARIHLIAFCVLVLASGAAITSVSLLANVVP